MGKYQPPYIGSAYYPEDWDESEIEKDADKMKAAGFNVARIAEFAWSKMERVEGVYTFDWLHKVIDTLASRGIATVLGTPTATPPRWLSKKYPDVMQEYENGRTANHGGRRHCCSNNPHYRAYCAKIVEAMAKEFANDENVIGWQIDNEIYSFGMGCYCQYCKSAFAEKLKSRFGNIENLNSAWNLGVFSQEYDCFDDIPLPRDAWVNPHHKMAWKQFGQESHISFVNMQVDILKKYTSAPIGTDTMPVGGMNYKDMCRKMDMVQFNHYNVPSNLWEVCFWFDFMRTMSKAPMWNTETSTCWNGSESITQTVKPDGFCYANSWLPIVLGGEANMYWLWRTHHAGHEIMHGSVLDASGRPMHIFNEVKKVAADFATAADYINGSSPVTDIAIHFPSHSWNFFDTQRVVEGLNYPGEVMRSYYKPIIDAGIRPDIIEAEEDLSRYKLVFSPFVATLENGDLADRIIKWVKKGGVWVVGPMTDIRDIDGGKFTDRPLGILEDLLGVYLNYSIPDRDRVIKATGLESSIWYEMYNSSENSLSTIENAPCSDLLGKAVMSEHKIGEGQVILLGKIPTYNDMYNVILPKSLEKAGKAMDQNCENFVVCRRDGTHPCVMIAEYAGVGGHYRLEKTMREVLSGRVLSGDITISPYEVLVLTECN